MIQDLPGIYSLCPTRFEEVVARDYLVGEKPDAIINIVDGTNIERNLYHDAAHRAGHPTVVAVNMIDVVRKNGDVIDLKKLGAALGCEVVATSALKGEGSKEAARAAHWRRKSASFPLPRFLRAAWSMPSPTLRRASKEWSSPVSCAGMP